MQTQSLYCTTRPSLAAPQCQGPGDKGPVAAGQARPNEPAVVLPGRRPRDAEEGLGAGARSLQEMKALQAVPEIAMQILQ